MGQASLPAKHVCDNDFSRHAGQGLTTKVVTTKQAIVVFRQSPRQKCECTYEY